MSGELRGVALKLNRAEAHLQGVVNILNCFAQTKLYDSFGELDYKGRPVARVRNVKVPPDSASIRIGECVYRMRSALDHIAYQLAMLNLGRPLTEREAKNSMFPIARKSARFREMSYRLRDVSNDAFTVIESLQPYHRRKRPNAITLQRLEELSNIDKHRLLLLTGLAPSSVSFEVSGPGLKRLDRIEFKGGVLKENARIGVFRGELDFDAGVDVKAHLLPDVVFDERNDAPSVRGKSVLLTLIGVADFLGTEAIPELAALFPDSDWIVEDNPFPPVVG